MCVCISFPAGILYKRLLHMFSQAKPGGGVAGAQVCIPRLPFPVSVDGG